MFTNYLSRNEKNNLVQFVSMQGMIEGTINRYADTPNPNKEFLKNLRASLTYMTKAVKMRTDALDDDAMVGFAKDVAKLEPVLFVPTDKARKEYKELAEMKSNIHMTKDDFEDWYEAIIENTCQICTEKDYKACTMYRILMKYDIVAINPEAKNTCPYSYLESEEAQKMLAAHKEHRAAKQNLEVIDRAEKKIIELLKEKEELQKQINDATACMALLGEKEKEARKEIADLEETLEKERADHRALEGAVDELKSEFASANEAKEQLENLVNDLHKTVEYKEDNFKRRTDLLKAEIARMKEKYEPPESDTKKVTLYFRGGQTIKMCLGTKQVQELLDMYYSRKRYEICVPHGKSVLAMSAVAAIDVKEEK